jgi:hypothetical protein
VTVAEPESGASILINVKKPRRAAISMNCIRQ